MTMTTQNDEAWAAARNRRVEELIQSDARKKLIVAGPGTGKTYAFKRLLQGSPGSNLAMTFINALVADLAKSLEGISEVYTFHGFCRLLLHSIDVPGITRGVDYFPAFNRIIAEDISLVDELPTERSDVEEALHKISDSDRLITLTLRSGDYYDAVGHTDAVYRVWKRIDEAPEDLPLYDQVVIDEYQDFSQLEVNFIGVIADRNSTLVVGDDDQALYGFKHASPDFLRRLAADEAWVRFELPFCTRCTEVIVRSVHLVIAAAQSMGLLQGRIHKPYICYLPEKREESATYPLIEHAACSVERNNAPYMAKYIHQKILEIPKTETEDSYTQGHPTVLVIGPMQFSRRIFSYLSSYFEDVELKEGGDVPIGLLDGYRRLIHNGRSRLGWRIVMTVDPPDDMPRLLHDALIEGHELADLLPAGFRNRHLRNARVVGKLLQEEELTEGEVLLIEEELGIPFLDLRRELLGETNEEEDSGDERNGTERPRQPRIIVTSLVGAKGLQADHVFVVGMNEGHFPMYNKAPTDDEVCSFLVALTRARKRCYFVSCDRFGKQKLRRSIFIDWVEQYIETRDIDAEYFKSLLSGS